MIPTTPNNERVLKLAKNRFVRFICQDSQLWVFAGKSADGPWKQTHWSDLGARAVSPVIKGLMLGLLLIIPEEEANKLSDWADCSIEDLKDED